MKYVVLLFAFIECSQIFAVNINGNRYEIFEVKTPVDEEIKWREYVEEKAKKTLNPEQLGAEYNRRFFEEEMSVAFSLFTLKNCDIDCAYSVLLSVLEGITFIPSEQRTKLTSSFRNSILDSNLYKTISLPDLEEKFKGHKISLDLAVGLWWFVKILYVNEYNNPEGVYQKTLEANKTLGDYLETFF